MHTLATVALNVLAPINVLLLFTFFAKPWLPSWASRAVGDKFISGLAVLVVFSLVVLAAWVMTSAVGSRWQDGRAGRASAVVVGLNCLVALSYLVFVLSDGI